ncbi:MAG: hypothetical protein ACI9UQ_002179, partial [Candidatus Krumholzibacteriia bacterium]
VVNHQNLAKYWAFVTLFGPYASDLLTDPLSMLTFG